MLDDVLGEEPPFDVGRATGRKVDQKRQPLAGIERFVGPRGARSERAEADSSK